MTPHDLRRTFWLGYAAILIICAAVFGPVTFLAALGLSFLMFLTLLVMDALAE